MVHDCNEETCLQDFLVILKCPIEKLLENLEELYRHCTYVKMSKYIFIFYDLSCVELYAWMINANMFTK